MEMTFSNAQKYAVEFSKASEFCKGPLNGQQSKRNLVGESDRP